MKIKLLYIFLSVTCFSVFGQVNSSYTRFGIGDIQYNYSARRLGMGGVNISIADPDFVSINNPATIYRLNSTRFELSVKYGGERISNSTLNKFYSNTVFNGFTFGFPISSLDGIGAAFGIVPVSSIKYDVVDNIINTTNSSNDYYYSYSGSGGLSKIFISSSYHTPFNVNIGASFNYYFGNLNYSSTVNFPNNNIYNSIFRRTYSPRGLGTTVGLLSPDMAPLINSSSITEFRIGASVDYIATLSTDTILVGNSYYKVDTLGESTVKMKVPVRISTGVSFILNNKYLFSIDYLYQPWSKFKFSGMKSDHLRNASKISAGFEYRPERGIGRSFWEQILLRAGLSYEKTQYIINGVGINQFSVSGGFSIPVTYENDIDIGLEYAVRGSKNNGLYKENIYKLNLSFALGDLWFIRTER
jgi:hypothetical protein